MQKWRRMKWVERKRPLGYLTVLQVLTSVPLRLKTGFSKDDQNHVFPATCCSDFSHWSPHQDLDANPSLLSQRLLWLWTNSAAQPVAWVPRKHGCCLLSWDTLLGRPEAVSMDLTAQWPPRWEEPRLHGEGVKTVQPRPTRGSADHQPQLGDPRVTTPPGANLSQTLNPATDTSGSMEQRQVPPPVSCVDSACRTQEYIRCLFPYMSVGVVGLPAMGHTTEARLCSYPR